MMDMAPLNVLFICSRNQWRSPTGERIWRRQSGINTRSAGTSPRAQRQVSLKDIQWADVIFVMEQKHKSRLMANFRQDMHHKTLHVLDIPDEYKFMNPELVDILQEATKPLIEKALGQTLHSED